MSEQRYRLASIFLLFNHKSAGESAHEKRNLTLRLLAMIICIFLRIVTFLCAPLHTLFKRQHTRPTEEYTYFKEKKARFYTQLYTNLSNLKLVIIDERKVCIIETRPKKKTALT